LKKGLRREKAHGGVRNVVDGTMEFAGRAKDILYGPFDVSFAMSTTLILSLRPLRCVVRQGPIAPTKLEMVGDTEKEAPESMIIGRSLSLRERYKVSDEGTSE
jgi:hypothetical protein